MKGHVARPGASCRNFIQEDYIFEDIQVVGNTSSGLVNIQDYNIPERNREAYVPFAIHSISLSFTTFLSPVLQLPLPLYSVWIILALSLPFYIPSHPFPFLTYFLVFLFPSSDLLTSPYFPFLLPLSSLLPIAHPPTAPPSLPFPTFPFLFPYVPISLYLFPLFLISFFISLFCSILKPIHITYIVAWSGTALCWKLLFCVD